MHITTESQLTLKEYLEDTTGLLIDEATNTLHTTTTGEAADSRLGDTLDVVTKDLAVALSTTLPETLATCRILSQPLETFVNAEWVTPTFSTSGHSC